MTKYVIDRFATVFLATINEQDSWGKDQIKNLFYFALSNVILDIIDNEEDLKKENNRIS